jgi:hypothetical protein
MSNPFRYFNTSPEVIRVVMTMYVSRRDDWSDESAGGQRGVFPFFTPPALFEHG